MKWFGSCFHTPRSLTRPTKPFLTTNNNKAPGHLYLIKEREFIKTKENVFKIGKTTNIKNRMPAYPKDSRVYVIMHCPTDIHVVEKKLIERFDAHFTKRIDIGHEYYYCKKESDLIFCFVETMVQLTC
jgi:hypothetical protein